MEKQIFMKVFETPIEAENFRSKLNQDPDSPYQFIQKVPLGKGYEVNNTRIVVLYVHQHEVE